METDMEMMEACRHEYDPHRRIHLEHLRAIRTASLTLHCIDRMVRRRRKASYFRHHRNTDLRHTDLAGEANTRIFLPSQQNGAGALRSPAEYGYHAPRLICYHAERIIRAMMEHLKDVPNIIGFQLDNETKSYGTAGPRVQADVRRLPEGKIPGHFGFQP